MHRRTGVQGDVSGWTIGVDGAAAVVENEQAEWIRATEILRVRRPLIVPLIAPEGWAVTWDGDKVVSMKDAMDEERWTPQAEAALRDNEERLQWAWRHPTGRSVPPS
jgi:hypothetical protein